MNVRPTDTVVVGAGPHGLTVATHLVLAGAVDPSRLTVIDPAGRWLAAWRSAFARLGIEHLRSPVVHHPHPDPYALLDHARDSGRSAELHGRYQVPGARLFDDFCDLVVERTGLRERVIAGTVTLIDGGAVDGDGADGGAVVRWRDPTGAGRTIAADRVIIAHNPRRATMPDGLPERIGHATPEHAGTVDLDRVVADEHVVVVGGGLTAGHLACGAVARGARVTLVTRRPVVEREFDTDPAWLGPREMGRFLAETCLERRASTAVAARGGGSVPGWMRRRLADLGDRLRATCPEPGVPLADHLDAVAGDADHVWCATGWSTEPAADPVLGPLVASARRVADLPVLGTRLEIPGTCVHVVGRPATLHLGPTAGNLAGARRAAALVLGEIDALG